MALIRDIGIVCESLIHGSLLKQNSGGRGCVSIALEMCFGVCQAVGDYW